MTTIIIDEKTRKGRIVLELIRELGVGEIIDENEEKSIKPNKKTLLAVKDALEGNTVKCDNFNDYLEKVK